MTMPVDVDASRPSRRDLCHAVLLLVTTVGLSVLWLVGGGWRVHEPWPFWANLLLGAVLPMLIPVGLAGFYVWLLPRSRPAALWVRADRSDPAFVALPHYLLLATVPAAQLTFAAVMAGQQLRTLEEFDGPALLALTAVTLLLLAGAVGMSLIWVVAIFRSRIRLELHPGGLLLVNLLGRQQVPWETIAVGPPPGSSRWGASPIGIHWPGLVGTTGRIRRYRQLLLPLHQLGVQGTFLTNAINHYLFHPEFRAAIGTLQEHERLQRALAVYGN